jgi:hypothetical protein
VNCRPAEPVPHGYACRRARLLIYHGGLRWGMADEQALPHAGMVISVVVREDVVVTDPDRLLAAARQAYRADNPDADEQDAVQAVADVYDAVYVLRDRYGSIASEHPDVAGGATPRRRMHGGAGLLRGDRVEDRPDGLSPASSFSTIVVGAHRPLQDDGCALPDQRDLFSIVVRPDTAG